MFRPTGRTCAKTAAMFARTSATSTTISAILRQDRVDRNQDQRHQPRQADINKDRAERNQDLKNGNTAAARAEQRDINHDKARSKS